MAKSKKSELVLPSLVQKFLNEENWGEEIEINEEEKSSILMSSLMLDDNEFQLIIETNEQEYRFLEIYIYSPGILSEKRTNEALKIINEINNRYKVGRLSIIEMTSGPKDEVNNRIQFKYVIDMTGIENSTVVLKNAIYHGSRLFEIWGSELYETTETNKSANEIFNA